MICLIALLGGLGCASTPVNLAALDAPAVKPKVFQVASFGTKGNGTADDGPAIQRALSAAAAAGGGKVTFPCGQFDLRSVAGAAPGARSILYLNNASAIQLVGQGHCTHIFTAMPQKSVFEFEDSQNISVSTMRITALNAKYVENYGMDGGSAIRFTGVTQGNIDHVEVDGASAGAIYLTKGTSHTSVTNNYVHDTYGSGIWEDDCGSANAQNCNPSSPPSYNVYDSNTLTNTTLAALAAIDLDDGNGLSHAIVQNNSVSWTKPPIAGNPQVHCIQVNNASDVSVLDNSCTGTPWDAVVVTTGVSGLVQNVTLQGNTIQSSGTSSIGGSGIVVYSAAGSLGISGVTVDYNNISTAADDGIRLYAASKPGSLSASQVLNNSITMVDQQTPGSRFGIDVEYSASITVSSNNISCNGTCIAAGVNVNSSTATTPTVTSNEVSDILGPPLVIH